MSDNQELFSELLTILKQEVDCYGRILVHSREQSELISQGKIQALFPVFSKITDEMAVIDALEKKMAPAKAHWEANKDNAPQPLKGEIEAAIDAVGDLLKEIIALEENQQSDINEQKTQNRTSMNKQQRTQQMAKAYGAQFQKPNKPSILDKES